MLYAYPVEMILDAISDIHEKRKKDSSIPYKFTLPYCDIEVQVSQTLRTIFLKGTTCCECGCKGSHFSYNDGTLKLYAKKDDKWTFLTKDHIIPVSLGGESIGVNLQVMCYECNSKKSNNFDTSNTEVIYYIQTLKNHFKRNYEWLSRYITFKKKRVYVDEKHLDLLCTKIFKKTGKIVKKSEIKMHRRFK